MRASKLPFHKSDLESGETNSFIYTVEGMNGLFRRVSREGRTNLRCGDGNVLCQVGNDLLELREWRAVNEILAPVFAQEATMTPEEATGLVS